MPRDPNFVNPWLIVRDGGGHAEFIKTAGKALAVSSLLGGFAYSFFMAVQRASCTCAEERVRRVIVRPIDDFVFGALATASMPIWGPVSAVGQVVRLFKKRQVAPTPPPV